MQQNGLLHIYMGGGKGKTTAAVGLAARVIGSGGRVFFAQFLKGRESGEVAALKTLGAVVERTDPVKKFLSSMNEDERAVCENSCRELFAKTAAALQSGEYALVVMDELLDVLAHSIIPQEAAALAIAERAAGTEAVITGREPGDALRQMADYITELRALRHPYEKGIKARRGIEY